MSVDKLLSAVERLVPGAAEVLIADAVWDMVYPQYIAERDAMIAKALDARFADAVRKAALRTYHHAGADPAFGVLDEYAEVVQVAKAQEQVQRDGWVQYINRDQKGRFSRRAVAGTTTEAAFKRGRRTQMGHASDLTGQRKAEYLHDQMQLLNLAGEMDRRLSRRAKQGTELVVHFKDRDRPSQVIEGDWTKENALKIDASSGPVHEFELRPKKDVDPSVGGELDALSAVDVLGRTDVTSAQMAQIVATLSPEAGQSRMSRLAQVLSGAGAVTGAVGARGVSDALQRASHGVEGGEALRPALTRAAYRYRGVEKTPDRQFTRLSMSRLASMKPGENDAEAIASLRRDGGAVVSAALADKARDSYGEEKKPRGSAVLPVLGQRLDAWDADPQQRPMTNEQALMAVSRDLTAQELVRRQTRSFVARTKESNTGEPEMGSGVRGMRRMIQDIAAGIGRDLPSEGVVIDADGDVVQQAVGVGGDHYQPFNLRGRKAMAGGQYVRTRQLGGITSDDIRTLLASGGRAATVVSASGVYDIELDPSLRNQTRLNAKVLGMVDTYERILDQLAGSQIYARDLPTAVKREARDAARKAAGIKNMDAAAEQKEYEKQLDKKRAEMTALTTADEKTARDYAQKNGGTSLSQQNLLYKERLEQLRREKVRKLNLNAEGYEVALHSLQAYYPYFIRDVSRRDLGEFMAASNDTETAKLAHKLTRADKVKDAQYVKPGSVRSGSDQGARTGLPRPLIDVNAPPEVGGSTPAAPNEPAEGVRGTRGTGDTGGTGVTVRNTPSGREPNPTPGLGENPVVASASPEQLSPLVVSARATTKNNAKTIYEGYVGAVAEGLARQVDDAFTAGDELLTDRDMRTDWDKKAFGQKRSAGDLKSDSGLLEVQYLLSSLRSPEALGKVASWIGGDEQKYEALDDVLVSRSGPMIGVEDLEAEDADKVRAALRGAAKMAYAVSLSGGSWRQPGSDFDGRPEAIDELAGVGDPTQFRSAVTDVLNTAAASGLLSADAVDKLASPATSLDDVEAKISARVNANKRLMGLVAIDAKIIEAGSREQNPLDVADFDAVVDFVGQQERGLVDSWLVMRGADPGGDRAEAIKQAYGADDSDVDERRSQMNKTHAAISASLALDAAHVAADAVMVGGGGAGAPKALLGLEAQDGQEAAEARANYREHLRQFLGPQLLTNKLVKSQRSRRVVRSSDRQLASSVADLVSKGMSPRQAALRSVSALRRSRRYTRS